MERSRYYITDEFGNPVPTDLMTWARWSGLEGGGGVAVDTVGEVSISTVFLGMDHNWGFSNVPILWETMVFGGVLDESQERYSSRREALEGHAKWVRWVTDGKPEDADEGKEEVDDGA